MQDFSIKVGNNTVISQLPICNSRHNAVPRGGSVTLNCQATGRYVAFRREGGDAINLVSICEFVVIGHPLKNGGEYAC